MTSLVMITKKNLDKSGLDGRYGDERLLMPVSDPRFNQTCCSVGLSRYTKQTKNAISNMRRANERPFSLSVSRLSMMKHNTAHYKAWHSMALRQAYSKASRAPFEPNDLPIMITTPANIRIGTSSFPFYTHSQTPGGDSPLPQFSAFCFSSCIILLQ